MKANWLRISYVAGLVIAGTAQAQSPDITSFGGNGMLTWTNSNTNLYYRIEWSPSLTAPDAWHSNYLPLADIRSSNPSVTSPVPMFYRICGSSNRFVYASPVPKTGQTNVYQAGDDGTYTNRMAWPNPRFTIGTGADGTNCVTDNLTGLVWARNASQFGQMTWDAALIVCTNLTYGGYSDWRLPNVQELQSLIDYGRYNPALCNTAGTGQWAENDPFTGVHFDFYWSSTTAAADTGYAWRVLLYDGYVHSPIKTSTYYVWPVRGGQ